MDEISMPIFNYNHRLKVIWNLFCKVIFLSHLGIKPFAEYYRTIFVKSNSNYLSNNDYKTYEL